ncbi:hypothetical protein QFZ40_002122 [Arthrobacter pascens]|nr:hypothetical protein [Arthrobacter pascens]
MAVSGWLGLGADIWTGLCRVSRCGRPNTLSELEIVRLPAQYREVLVGASGS